MWAECVRFCLSDSEIIRGIHQSDLIQNLPACRICSIQHESSALIFNIYTTKGCLCHATSRFASWVTNLSSTQIHRHAGSVPLASPITTAALVTTGWAFAQAQRRCQYAFHASLNSRLSRRVEATAPAAIGFRALSKFGYACRAKCEE